MLDGSSLETILETSSYGLHLRQLGHDLLSPFDSMILTAG
jgi:hypothetical protein